MYDIAIIGGGVSGYGAALYAGRFKLKTAVIVEKPGGAIVLTNDVANYPGFKKISGFELARAIEDHAKEYDIEVFQKKATKVDKNKGCFRIHMSEKIIDARTIIFATGTEWRKLNVPGEANFSNNGVHYCALCDGAFYKDKIIGIVGGSDSAAKEALLLSEYGKKVYIIYRKEKIRAEPITANAVEKNKKIEIINNTNVVEIKGDKHMESVVLDKPHKGSKEFKLDALFIAIGHIPLSEIAKEIGVKLNQKNEIIIDRDSRTNLPGVFAAGDVVDTKFKQAITGVAEGVTAAYSAYQYLTQEDINCG